LKREFGGTTMKKYFTGIFIVMLVLFLSETPAPSEILQGNLTDSTGIIGIDMVVGTEAVPVVKDVFYNTPADKAGLRAGDRILAINNRPTYGMNSHEVDYAIPDIPGSNVKLSVLRNHQYLHFELTVVPLHLTDKNTQKQYQYYYLDQGY
jgi:C-terminal processing protease CtpA/Prc